jgi:hypothetical protein
VNGNDDASLFFFGNQSVPCPLPREKYASP